MSWVTPATALTEYDGEPYDHDIGADEGYVGGYQGPFKGEEWKSC